MTGCNEVTAISSGCARRPTLPPGLRAGAYAQRRCFILGVFGGKYMTEYLDEFPRAVFWASYRRGAVTFRSTIFGVDASQSLSVWRGEGLEFTRTIARVVSVVCRYYLGRRLPGKDIRQIRRWKAMRRHVAQIRNHCEPGDRRWPTTPAQHFFNGGLRQP